MCLCVCVVMSGRPVGVTFPNQFQLGNPENVSGKLEIHFDDLIVESIQRKTFREIQKRQKAERRKRARREMDHQKIINQIKKIVSLMRKQESNHKKMMKLYKVVFIDA